MKQIRHVFWIAILFILASPPGWAEVSIGVQIAKPVLRMGETTQLTIQVNSTNAQTNQVPSLPELDGLTLNSRGAPMQQFSFSSANGQTRQSYIMTYRFDVIPQLPGTYTLDTIHIDTPQGTITAEPVTLTVLEADQSQPTQSPQTQQVPSSNSHGIYLLADVSEKEVYVGEEIILNFYLLIPIQLVNRVQNVGQLSKSPGQFQDFWMETHELGPNNEEENVRLNNNEVYRKVTLLRYSLFPLRSGEFQIPSITIKARVGRPVRMLFNRYEEVPVQSNAIALNVMPLPERGKPETFEGAVGTFQLSSFVEETAVQQGDTATLRVVLEGAGNMQNVPAPRLPDLSGFDLFDPTTEEDIRVDRNGVTGRIEYTHILIPHSPTDTEIGPVRFSYFDPDEETYVELQTDSIPLEIIPVEGAGRMTSGPTRRMVVRTGDDFRFITTSPLALAQVSLAVYQSPLFWLGGLTPLIGLASLTLWRRRDELLNHDPARKRLQMAPRIAEDHLREAHKAFQSGDRETVYTCIGKAIRGYLETRWDLTLTGMTHTELHQALHQCGYTDQTASRIQELLDIVDGVRFSGASTIHETQIKGDLDRADHLFREMIRQP